MCNGFECENWMHCRYWRYKRDCNLKFWSLVVRKVDKIIDKFFAKFRFSHEFKWYRSELRVRRRADDISPAIGRSSPGGQTSAPKPFERSKGPKGSLPVWGSTQKAFPFEGPKEWPKKERKEIVFRRRGRVRCRSPREDSTKEFEQNCSFIWKLVWNKSLLKPNLI